MKRKGIKGNIPTNHTIRKHLKVSLTGTKGKFKSKYRKKHNFWPFMNKNEWDKHKQYFAGKFCDDMVQVYNILGLDVYDDLTNGLLSVTPNYSKKYFYSIEKSDICIDWSLQSNSKRETSIYKSKKSLKKQKGCNKVFI